VTSVLGKALHRIEDPKLLTGKGRYVDDISLPGLLHCAFVRSTTAHARLGPIDLDIARSMPGVHAILTAEDLKPALVSTRMRLSASPDKGEDPSTPFVLQSHEVAYVGEPIALVVANSRAEAEDAASAVMIDYEPLDVVLDPRDARGTASAMVRSELDTNILRQLKVAYGDTEAAFSGAAHIVSDKIWQHRGGGHPIETRGVVVESRFGGSELCVWSSTQMPHDLYYMLCEMLDMDQNRLRVITPDVGGGFGPKYCLYPEEIALPAAARLLDRNLKWIEDRRENFVAAIQERDQYWHVDMAIDAAGKILGIRGELIHDQGAYSPKAPNLAYNSATAMPGPYVVPAYDMDVFIVYTNKVPVSSVRGAGYPQAAFAMERMLDLAADRLDIDRTEIRARNLIPPEKMPYTKALTARSGAAMVYDSGDYPALQADALSTAGWHDFPERQKAALEQGRYIGIGVANAVKGTGRGPFESGTVRVSQNGKVSIFTGAVAMGQGLATALAQICAEELSVDIADITVIAGDTAVTPLGLGGFASRQLVTAGSSVHLASINVAAKAKKAASRILDVDEAELDLREGRVWVRGSNRSMGLGELAQVLRGAPGFAFPADLEPGLESAVQWKTDALAYANACHVAEVEVDVDVGGVTINRYVAFHDSGKLINPMIVDGQILGGIVHGIGNALYEFMGYDETGQPLTTTFQDYLLVTATELPQIETHYRETPSTVNPIGAKGVGEAGTIPAAAAIISAVENALAPFGVRISQTPVSPQILFNLIEAARQRAP
jgi:aerobic carbon-monoxide dehydrogenase large subunit